MNMPTPGQVRAAGSAVPQSLAASPLTKHAWLWQRLARCSTSSLRVLGTMDALNAYSPSTRCTDTQICKSTGIPFREVIDLRGELLAAGLVICTNGDGSYMSVPGSDLTDARRTRESMRSRARDVFIRAKHLRQAIDLYEQHARPADSTGQGMLGMDMPVTPAKRMEAFTR
jgi:hypothetical protein